MSTRIVLLALSVLTPFALSQLCYGDGDCQIFASLNGNCDKEGDTYACFRYGVPKPGCICCHGGDWLNRHGMCVGLGDLSMPGRRSKKLYSRYNMILPYREDEDPRGEKEEEKSPSAPSWILNAPYSRLPYREDMVQPLPEEDEWLWDGYGLRSNYISPRMLMN